MRIVLDTNCFIDAVSPTSHAYQAMQHILHACDAGTVQILVSRNTITELEAKPGTALALANTAEILPFYPVGQIADLVGMIKDLAGTLEDAGRNEAIQADLKALAKSGTVIRDRGAFIDALLAKADAFVTSDGALSDAGPAERIAMKYGLRILTPQRMARVLGRITRGR